MKHDQSRAGGIAVFHRFRQASYDRRRSGPIGFLNYAEDRIALGGAAVQGAFALEQNGIVYQIDLGSFNAGVFTAGVWQHVVRANLRPPFNFSPLPGPDFSANGSEIFFGYVRATATLDMYGGDVEHGIDNWRVEVHKTGSGPSPRASSR
jgi:hypothetical protein